jgi:hypothetical protein
MQVLALASGRTRTNNGSFASCVVLMLPGSRSRTRGGWSNPRPRAATPPCRPATGAGLWHQLGNGGLVPHLISVAAPTAMAQGPGLKGRPIDHQTEVSRATRHLANTSLISAATTSKKILKSQAHRIHRPMGPIAAVRGDRRLLRQRSGQCRRRLCCLCSASGNWR